MAHDERHHSPPHTPAAGPSRTRFHEAGFDPSCTRKTTPSTTGDGGSSTTQARALMQWLGGERRLSPHANRIYRKVYRRMHAGLGSHIEAEDATQAVFLEAIKNRASIRKGLPEYVGGVGRMKLREHYRRRARYARTVSLSELGDLPAEDMDASKLLELELGPLVRALEQLPLDDQRCLALVYGRELRNVDAAAELGLSKVGFNNRIGHARARLRKALVSGTPEGAARSRSSPSFQGWVESVLGLGAQAAREGSPLGNRSL
jgi:RNA polymerase sigma factor (sigma-70 family)